MSIRVFISHSTQPRKGETANAVLSAQHDFIRQFKAYVEEQIAGASCFIDRDIPPGNNWKDVLFKEMHDCHAAVVFVNRQALEDSDWVTYEVTTLMNRWRCEKERFHLIPVPFVDVTAQDIAKHQSWNPAEPGQVQCLPVERLDIGIGSNKAVEDFFSKIIALLKKVPDDDEFTSWIVKWMASDMPDDIEILQDIAKKVDYSGYFSLHNYSKYNLVRCLYFNGTVRFHELAEVPGFIRKISAGDFLNYLATYWVDIKSSFPIFSNSKSKKSNVFVINGKEVKFTPRVYVRHVCMIDPEWTVLEVDIKSDYVEQIYSELLKIHRYDDVFNFSYPSVSPDSIKKVSDAMGDDNDPVFVAFLNEGGGRIDDVVHTIRRAYEYINIIICTAMRPGEEFSLFNGDLVRLDEISLEKESEEYLAYCHAFRCVQKLSLTKK